MFSDEARTQAHEAQDAVVRLTAELDKKTASAAKSQADEAGELRKQRKALEAEREKSAKASAKLAEERSLLEKERAVTMQAKRGAISPKEGTTNAPVQQVPKVRKATSMTALRQSSTASALQAILDGSKDTPPQIRPLTVGQPNVVGQRREKPSVKVNEPRKQGSKV